MKTFKDYEDRWQKLDFSKITLKKMDTNEIIPHKNLSIIVKHTINEELPSAAQYKQTTEDDATQES